MHEVAKRFGLSDAAAKVRTEELARMYRRRHGLKRQLPPGVIDFLSEKRRQGHQITSLPAAEIVSMHVRQPTYEGETCPNCSNFTMFRIGTQLKCDTCGTITGEG